MARFAATLLVAAGASLAVARPASAQTSTSGPARSLTATTPLDPWPQYAGNAQHTAVSRYAAQPLNRILWSTPVDERPQYSGPDLLIHYTPPLLSQGGTVVLPVKTRASDGFVLRGFDAATGVKNWEIPSKFATPPAGWTPVCPAALLRSTFSSAFVRSTLGSILGGTPIATPTAGVVADSGGRLIYVPDVDATTPMAMTYVFYGEAHYKAHPTPYDNHVFINTPITVDAKGVCFFGVQVTGHTPLGLQSGLVRMQQDGIAQYLPIQTIVSGYGGKIATNCGPALSNDGALLYVALNGAAPKLIAVDTQTLALVYEADLRDPSTGNSAVIIDESTATPMVGPDGDVYYGILENPWFSNNDRGYMLHFDSKLVQKPYSGDFGWDDTAAVVPADAVPSYHGHSSYLILTKYNNYYGIGTGDGKNKVAILDPNQSMGGTTPFLMKEILTVLGVTPDPGTNGGVREWCINSAVVDPSTRAAILNSEDGTAYRWDFTINRLSQSIPLTAGIGEAYTTTEIGADGHAYAISNATLFVLGQ
jgi:hypothetical protein